ncbi:DUF559 domain-containing protein [Nonomuraea pusilla]|uniref:endonuclease domain-containing protein n=1 Tax=Nonomuraea pusilla TaxID=46177 RepID=UPI00331DA3E2
MTWWAALPSGRVTRLDGADPAAVALALDPLPDGAPAVVTYLASPARSVTAFVGAVLDELDAAALALFPAWLPEAAAVDGPGGANLAAVRALALRRAAAVGGSGPFLAELARRALAGGASRFTAEVRVAGLARVLAESFGRERAALLVRVPDGLPPAGQEVLVAAAEWLAHRGGLGVWLTGAPLDAVDRVPVVPVALPGPAVPVAPSDPAAVPVAPSDPAAVPVALSDPAAVPVGRSGHAGGPGEPSLTVGGPPLAYPPVAGRPHPGSRSEQALEEALARCPWAAGRAWNQTYQPHPLVAPVRVDLLWREERCVVEIDGPEHREALAFAADRQRDVRLQLDGYAVLRFTDVQVLTDRESVVRQIGRFLRKRRTEG